MLVGVVLLVLVLGVTGCRRCSDACYWTVDCYTRGGELVYTMSGSGCWAQCPFPLFPKNVNVWCPDDADAGAPVGSSDVAELR